MRRREFITLLGGAAAASPLAAQAQPSERMRRMGVLMNSSSNDQEARARVTAFLQALERLGWTSGGNERIEIRWAANDPSLYHQYSEELVALAPDVVLAATSASVAALQQVSKTVPIVFAGVIDPVGAGFVNSMARPATNATGFTAFEYSISGKWLELLKEFVPKLKRAAVLRDPALAAGIGQFAVIQSMAASTQLELSAIDSRDLGQTERALHLFAQEPDGGLILTASPSAFAYRGPILSLAIRLRLPSIAPFRYYAAAGGLASYGPDLIRDFPRAAGYVDSVLRGAKVAELPVQAPTTYELVVNARTARQIGIEVPNTLLSRADEVIE
jgi:putative tryptophan/tyrosine transport system substrate-binding protein